MSEFIGTVVIEVDNAAYNVEKFDVNEDTGRKPIKAMSKDGVSPGFSAGIKTFEISLTVLVPLAEPMRDWGSMVDGVITMSPLNDPSRRTTWVNCYTTKVGTSTATESEYKISLTVIGRNKIEE